MNGSLLRFGLAGTGYVYPDVDAMLADVDAVAWPIWKLRR